MIICVKDLSDNQTKLMTLPSHLVSDITNKARHINCKNKSFIISKTKTGEYKVDIVSKIVKMNVLQLKKTLKDMYPSGWFNNGYHYDPEYKNCIWTGSQCLNEDGEELFDKNYYLTTDGVHPDLHKFLEDNEWHCEWINNDTVIICEN